MKSRYSISIPKPCHENWSEMTPTEKGRYCQSCSKTVIDFTKMKTDEVQTYIHNNKHQRICGHIKQSQLDTINLKVSETVFEQTMSFHKLFLLALLLAMGTSLLSCADDSGHKKKIDSIEIVQNEMDSTQSKMIKNVDSIKTQPISKVNSDSPINPDSNNEVIIQTVGVLEMNDTHLLEEKPIIHPDSIIGPEHVEIEGEIEVYEDLVFGMITVNIERLPEFKNTPKNLKDSERNDYFKKSISEFVGNNFKTNYDDIDLKGQQRIYAKFIIDKKGNVKDIEVKAPSKWFEKETKRVVSLLPQFIPATQNGRPVEMPYSIPIIFNIED